MTTSPLSVNKLRLVFVVFWIIWSVVQFFVIRDLGIFWKEALTDSLLANALLLAACLLISNNLRYYLPQSGRYWYIIFWSAGVTLLWIVISHWLLHFIFAGDAQYLSFLEKSIPVRAGMAVLAIGCMSMVSLLWYSLHDQQEQEERKVDAERLSREAELYKLRQQLQPHFLFNSLNSINALIGSRPEEARKMIQQLSDFLRGTLKKDEQQWVTLSEELRYLQLYLDIEKVRFGHRLTTKIEIEEETTSPRIQLPAMLLQPVVENAIKFGLYDTTGDITIRINSKLEENQLIITIQNPFDPATSAAAGGTGFGLKVVQRRLYLLFARNDLLVTKAEEQLFTTIIKIPQKHD